MFSANFQVDIPNTAQEGSFASYFANDWHFTGIGILQSGEPWSLYEFYGAVGSINFGNLPTLMNPVLGIKDPAHPNRALTGNKGATRDASGDYIPYVDPSKIAITYLAPGTNGIPVSTGDDPVDICQTAFNVGQRNIFRQDPQRRLDLSLRKVSRSLKRSGFRMSATRSIRPTQPGLTFRRIRPRFARTTDARLRRSALMMAITIAARSVATSVTVKS